MVDELMGPARKKLVSHKLIVSAKLAETTLANLNRVIAASTWVSVKSEVMNAQPPVTASCSASPPW